MSDLQLQDYMDGYRFQVKCTACGYEWYQEPQDLRELPHSHDRMYIAEFEQVLVCRSCHKTRAKITPIIIMPTHHFVGGMA